MGRWGEPPTSAPRERTIAVRMKKPPKTFLTTPEKVGKENNLYPRWVEKLWHLYEGDLIRVAGDLDAGALQQGDEAFLLFLVVEVVRVGEDPAGQVAAPGRSGDGGGAARASRKDGT
jgi:hypothetical protein